mmetsp:Transcript_33462/g.79367  ORF Transcript_33462/g.79367 Transcript_33462/m.79367 type:complete len:227 (-) Transcript_33462:131-811(-)
MISLWSSTWLSSHNYRRGACVPPQGSSSTSSGGGVVRYRRTPGPLSLRWTQSAPHLGCRCRTRAGAAARRPGPCRGRQPRPSSRARPRRSSLQWAAPTGAPWTRRPARPRCSSASCTSRRRPGPPLSPSRAHTQTPRGSRARSSRLRNRERCFPPDPPSENAPPCDRSTGTSARVSAAPFRLDAAAAAATVQAPGRRTERQGLGAGSAPRRRGRRLRSTPHSECFV